MGVALHLQVIWSIKNRGNNCLLVSKKLDIIIINELYKVFSYVLSKESASKSFMNWELLSLSYLYSAGLSSLGLALSLAPGSPDGHPEDPVHRLRLDPAARGRRVRLVLHGVQFNGVGNNLMSASPFSYVPLLWAGRYGKLKLIG